MRITGNAFANPPVYAVLSGLLGRGRTLQEQHQGRKVLAQRGLAFRRSEYVFADPGGALYDQPANDLRIIWDATGSMGCLVMSMDWQNGTFLEL